MRNQCRSSLFVRRAGQVAHRKQFDATSLREYRFSSSPWNLNPSSKFWVCLVPSTERLLGGKPVKLPSGGLPFTLRIVLSITWRFKIARRRYFANSTCAKKKPVAVCDRLSTRDLGGLEFVSDAEANFACVQMDFRIGRRAVGF